MKYKWTSSQWIYCRASRYHWLLTRWASWLRSYINKTLTSENKSLVECEEQRPISWWVVNAVCEWVTGFMVDGMKTKALFKIRCVNCLGYYNFFLVHLLWLLGKLNTCRVLINWYSKYFFLEYFFPTVAYCQNINKKTIVLQSVSFTHWCMPPTTVPPTTVTPKCHQCMLSQYRG